MTTTHHDAELLHQFDDLAQQRLAVRLGMWVFLITEVMLFGGLFCAYTIYRVQAPQAFGAASRMLDIQWGAINTAVLIASSFTMALAVRQAELARKKSTIALLAATMLLGATFLGIKAIEYAHKAHEHLIPGAHFVEPAPEAGSGQLFFSFYFVMTGTHAFHMILGLGVLLAMIYTVARNPSPERRRSQVEIAGLYWHFVDIVWVFLFPLLYLVERH
jgi:cytochrome c oxidase subunit III